MINKLKPKSEFSRNVLTLMTGTTIAQAIPIAISPILTRIYTPEDFGVFAVFIAITSILGSIINGRYELAIMLPKKDEDAINILALGFIINIVLSSMLLVIILLFHSFLLDLLNNKEISLWLYFIPISVFLMGCFNLLNYFNTRKKLYKDLAKANIYKSIGMAVVQLSFGVLKTGAFGLMSGQVFSQIVSNTKLFLNIKKLDLFSKITRVKIVTLGKRYKDFPIFNLPSTLADITTVQLSYLFIPKIYSLQMTGFFSLAQKLIAIPSSLIARAISQVLFQKISTNNINGIKNMPIIINTIMKLFFIALPIAIIIYIFAPIIFPYIFGKQWVVSGDIAQYLSLIFIITFIVSTMSIVLPSYKELKSLAKWQYLYFGTSLSLYISTLYLDIKIDDFLFLLVCHEYLLYLIYLILILKTVLKYDKKLKV